MKIWVLAFLLVLVGVAPAEAHLVSSGLGPFYDGALHLLLSPEDLLAIVAVALVAGLRGPAHGRVALLTLPVVWAIATLLRLPLRPEWMDEVKAALIFVAAGLAAVDLPLRKVAVFGVSALVGLACGASGEPSITASAVAGLTIAIGVVLSLTLGLVLAATLRLGTVPTRVASWAAATALLMIGWAIRLASEGRGSPSLS